MLGDGELWWAVVLGILALYATGVLAQEDRTLSADMPTTNADGTPLTDLAGWRVYVAPLNDTVFVLAADNEALVPGAKESTILSLQPGEWELFATAYDFDDNESQPTNVITTLVGPIPVPDPGNLIVSGDMTVYTINQSADFISLVPIGTVPLGTECNGSFTVNGMYVVAKNEVTWFGNTRSEVVLAQCQPSSN